MATRPDPSASFGIALPQVDGGLPQADGALPQADDTPSQAYAAWMAAHPESLPVHRHPWDVTRSDIYTQDRWQPIFAAMRGQAPVNKVTGSPYGDFWNVTTAATIREVEGQPELFSSSFENGGIALAEPPADCADNFQMPMFIAMDGTDHSARRQAVAPAFAPAQMLRMALDIRERTTEVLDSLPVGESFDWVERVSVELAAGTLAQLLGVPLEDRRLLSDWSDWASDIDCTQVPELFARRRSELRDMARYFGQLWLDRIGKPRGADVLSMMMHSGAMGQVTPEEFMGNLMLMVVGGNDTTRNTMSGLVHALDAFPDQRALVESDRTVIPNAVHEAIRFVTPLAHMRRTATCDTELAGQHIVAGDKLALWYISANRDEALFADPDRFDVTRANARHHLSFGHGAHRCVGSRLAELQLRILMEEMHDRRVRVHVTGAAERVLGNFAHGFRQLMVEVERG